MLRAELRAAPRVITGKPKMRLRRSRVQYSAVDGPQKPLPIIRIRTHQKLRYQSRRRTKLEINVNRIHWQAAYPFTIQPSITTEAAFAKGEQPKMFYKEVGRKRAGKPEGMSLQRFSKCATHASQSPVCSGEG